MINIFSYGAIDIGSNAIRLIITNIYQFETKTQYKKLTLVRVPIRLGEDVFTLGKISNEKQTLLLDALTGFSYLLKAYQIKEFRACATSAMREASNSAEIINLIRKSTGINIEIISGKEEAYLIQTGGIADIMDNNNTYLYVDVGGGSTEIILYSNRKKITSNSFPIGTVRLLSKTVAPDIESKMKQWLNETLKEYPNITIIASGGNINKFQKLINNKEGKLIKAKQIKKTRDYLAELSIEERLSILGLSSHRADVIVPALDIFYSIIKTVKAKEILVPKIGLGDGIIRALHRKHIETIIQHAKTT
ncbi:MAG: hypothetical protein PHU27_06545 [Salinivirgaceae bacterium]|nr:hypothetical protein [Salinivirgaceae bacterium]